MKRSKDINGLPLLAINKGDFVSRVIAPVINPEEGKIDYLLLEGQEWYMEKRIIKFGDIAAIGNDAVTTEAETNIKPVTALDAAIELLKKNAAVLDSKIVTKDGRFVGVVSEFLFDEKSGKISSCELALETGLEAIGLIPASKILTFGPSCLVVAEDFETFISDDPVKQAVVITPEPAVSTPKESGVLAEEDASHDNEDPLTLFNEKQRQYLIGKKAGKTIVDANGNIIISEGSLITEEIIEKAMLVDKFIELTMFVE